MLFEGFDEAPQHKRIHRQIPFRLKQEHLGRLLDRDAQAFTQGVLSAMFKFRNDFA